MQATTGALGRASDGRVIAVIGAAHCGSHFFHLVLPPLFPALKAAFGVSYTELGLLVTAFFLTSGLAQTPAGFLVDRIGAARVLACGLAILGVGALLAAFAPTYWLLLPLAVLMGLGNSVFHPADYSIMSHHVTPSRMARAFSVHTVGGSLGWAAAPVAMAAIASVASWRVALAGAALVGLVLALTIALHRSRLETPRQERHDERGGLRDALQLFASRPILLCFAFFVLLAITFITVQSFMPLALHELWDMPIVLATGTVTAFMLGSVVGTLLGGVVADRTGQLHGIIAVGLLASALVMVLVAYAPMPIVGLFTAVTIAGGFVGFTTPARDLLVRGAAPKEATGKVFGFVYSGLDLGALLAPVVAGLMLDNGLPRGVFLFVALATVLTILTATSVRTRAPDTAAAAER